MKKNITAPSLLGGSQSQSQSQVGLIWQKVRDQIEIECFDERDRPAAETIALIISEVISLPEKDKITIDGVKMRAEDVQHIFCRLDHDHVAGAISRFREIPYEVRHKKTYMRTVLYNAVLESEIDLLNLPARVGAGE